MPRRSRDTRAVLRTIQRSERRSALFWWFVENHDEIQKAAQGARIDWASFCAEAAKRGLTDTHGHAPTERNARETWRQARRAVSEARSHEAAQGPTRKGSVYPSRIPKDWKPEAFRPAVAPAPVAPTGTSLVPAPPTNQEPYDWRKRLDQLAETINARSGRKG
jgi:hypothetical protein